MQKIKQAIIEANIEVYRYIKESLTIDDFDFTGVRGAGGDCSSVIDLKAEEIFIKHLLKFADINTEERGFVNSSSLDKEGLFIIDPIDGSDNFLSNHPYYGSCVAYVVKNNIKLAVITNFNNANCMIFDGLNKESISLENKTKIRNIEIKNPQIGIFERSYAFPKLCQALYKEDVKYRSPGAIALSLANAHNYKFVLFGGDKRDFDIKAGLFFSKDLYSYEDDEFLLVAKDFVNFQKIKEIIKEF